MTSNTNPVRGYFQKWFVSRSENLWTREFQGNSSGLQYHSPIRGVKEWEAVRTPETGDKEGKAGVSDSEEYPAEEKIRPGTCKFGDE
jgi:hypothetical protein